MPKQNKQKIIEEKGYINRILMQTKVSYSGKEVLQMTFIRKEEKRAAVFKAGRDRPTLLFCANALGFMLRIAIIHKAANP